MSGAFPRLSGPPEAQEEAPLQIPARTRNARESGEGDWAQKLMALEILLCLGLGLPNPGPLCLVT